jgi:membrane protein DedA with SNARE-associated domain
LNAIDATLPPQKVGGLHVVRRIAASRSFYNDSVTLLRDRAHSFPGILVARFVPGGRTGATFTSGLTAFPYLRYALFTAVAALLWAVYAVFLGYFGGRVFHERPLLAVGVAFALAAALFVAITLVRRILASRTRALRGTEEARC